MVKRTSMNLDTELVKEAALVLGTKTATETVHRALQESVRRQHLARLTRRSFSDLSGDKLKELRRARIDRLDR